MAPFEGFGWVLAPSCALVAVGLDRAFGEPARFHPLVGFGRLAAAIERTLRRAPARHNVQISAGLAAWGLAVLPPVVVAAALRAALPAWAGALLDVALLTFALGAKSLADHVRPIAAALIGGDLGAARAAVGRVVSRDPRALDACGVARAAVETTLENGNDAVFGALFWFALAGGPGALLFRLANTLDAMWGYRNDTYLHFGRAAARIDDALNYLPARLTALTYALQGRAGRAFACWRRQAGAWDSPNAGPVMAAGAGSLGVSLGGPAVYDGRREERPPLGEGPVPGAADVGRALALVQRGVAVWLLTGFALAALAAVSGAGGA